MALLDDRFPDHVRSAEFARALCTETKTMETPMLDKMVETTHHRIGLDATINEIRELLGLLEAERDLLKSEEFIFSDEKDYTDVKQSALFGCNGLGKGTERLDGYRRMY